MEKLLVERGEDQLVEVDQATEADGELTQLLAHRGQPPRQGGRGLVLSGLQGGQHVALDARVCVQIRKNLVVVVEDSPNSTCMSSNDLHSYSVWCWLQ